MTSGRGIVAAALVIFASWLPARYAGGLLIRQRAGASAGSAESGVDVSPFLLFMLPYVLTLAALFIVERRQKARMPEGLSQVFNGTS